MKIRNRNERPGNVRGKWKSLFSGIVCLIPIVLLAGCASSYDCYTCGRVSCSYCPPNPLPSSNCPSSNCNDSIGQSYLTTLSSASYLESAPDSSADTDYYVPSPQQQIDANENEDSGLNNQ